jgi:hypothetical protein
VLHADNDRAATALALAQARSRLVIHRLQLARWPVSSMPLHWPRRIRPWRQYNP